MIAMPPDLLPAQPRTVKSERNPVGKSNPSNTIGGLAVVKVERRSPVAHPLQERSHIELVRSCCIGSGYDHGLVSYIVVLIQDLQTHTIYGHVSYCKS